MRNIRFLKGKSYNNLLASCESMAFSFATIANILIIFATLTNFFILSNIFPLLVKKICFCDLHNDYKTTSTTLNFSTTTTLTMATSTSFPIVIMCCYIHLLEWNTISATSFIIFHQNFVILFCYKKVRYQVGIFFKSFFAILQREHIRCMKSGEYVLKHIFFGHFFSTQFQLRRNSKYNRVICSYKFKVF